MTRASTFRTRRPGAVLRPEPAVGVSVPKRDGADKVTGRALYVDDLKIPGMLHGRTVRSTIARGIIRRIEFDPAFDWNGVVIADHQDIPGENCVAHVLEDQPLLAVREIEHADQAILLLAHADPERAEAALGAVRVEVESLDAVLSIEDALAARVKIHGADNVFKEYNIARGDLAAGFAAAAVVVEGVYRCGHQEQLYLENNGMIGERTAEGGIVVRGSMQCPYFVHDALQRMFGLPPEKVRVIQTVTGGGFGGKEDYPSVIAGHAALLAWKSGRPVKLVYDRLEDIASTTKRHPALIRVRTGHSRDGTLVATDVDVVMDGGAYMTLSPRVLSRGALHAGGAYRCPNVRIRARAVATNTPPNGAFRGFGAPQTLYAIESHMERVAAELGLDPLDLRLRNAVVRGDQTPTGQVLRESVSAVEVLDRTAKRVGWTEKRRRYGRENAAAERAERAGRFAPGGRRLRRGIGLALGWHGASFTGSGEVRLAAVAALELSPEGRPRVLAASAEIGQGAITVFTQMVAERLGVAPGLVLVETPDTDRVPDSGPTVASRTTMVVGGLLEDCARGLRERLELFAERAIDGGADFQRVARRFLDQRGPLRVGRGYRKPPWIEWNDDTYQGDAYPCFSYGAIAVEVEVDLDTGEVRVLKATTAQDVGKAIHPLLCTGQIEGGTLQGLGWALLEEVRWKDGRIWNHQLTNYIIPTSMDAPPFDVVLVENPFPGGPFGAKGVGELPMDLPAGAVVAAIAHATGACVDEIPITPERLLRALDGRKETR
jgi:CO/xanthine dehydrogenase Mo-binding subunit